jgi:hypothetical protein
MLVLPELLILLTESALESSSGALIRTRTEDKLFLAHYRAPRCISAHRSDIHEEPSVKTGARRLRDFPDIHSASSAAAEATALMLGLATPA